ncbi:MAG TPA: methyltransferase domain-containing protein [Caulobacteraceae bacterium]|jgi:SAM-dependent methyltransferase|nr:methyltransferase domain-containing protein [Caulobacteraceae bacterium]
MTAPAAAQDRSYLLGTHDQEIERLGLQHRVWRPKVLEAWRRAGITVGSAVVDAGAGPGWATLDLAEIVGPEGRVHALERSERFLAHLEGALATRRLGNVSAANLDLVTDPLPASGVDAFWIRWVLAFVGDAETVLKKLAATLKPGGVAVIHEYLDYDVWGFAPRRPALEAFRKFKMDDWRQAGGEPDIGRSLPDLLPRCGLKIRELRPMVEAVRPGDFFWQWPRAFLDTYPQHLADEGKVDQAFADRVTQELREAEADPQTVMITPLVLEVIAEKV